MRYFLKKDNSELYILPKRCGSSLFLKLFDNTTSVGKNFHHIAHDVYEESISQLDPAGTIYFTYRDPFKRFISGLFLSLHEFQVDDLITYKHPNDGLVDPENIKIFHNSVQQLFSSHLRFADNFTGQRLIPYHLHDQHCDHILWRPAILSYAGYNVKLINVDSEYTDHLLNKFPGDRELIESVIHTKFKYYHNDFRTMICWEIYKSVYVESGMEFTVTWEEWMDKEYDIFDLFKNNKDNLDSIKDHLMTSMQEKNYLFDYKSPYMRDMVGLVKKLNELNKTVHPYIKDKIERFENIFKSCKEYSLSYYNNHEKNIDNNKFEFLKNKLKQS